MTPFEKALSHTLGIEGGYVDDPTDRGGRTNFGITEGVARRHGYRGEMRNLPKRIAVDIYHGKYWGHRRLNLDTIADWHEPAALELFDTGVNMGVRRAAVFFQTALNALNRAETLYPDLVVDGWAGKATMDALGRLRTDVDKRVLVKMLDTLQGAHYLKIMAKDHSQEAFARGWFDRRVGL